MGYSKHTWKKGDIITAKKLNEMEEALETNANNIDRKVEKPSGGNGNDGQLLKSKGDGSTEWTDPPATVVIDNTLTHQGQAADAKKVADELAKKVAKPADNGTDGQVLITKGNGTTEWKNLVTASGKLAKIDDATSETDVKDKFNSLLADLKAKGLMENS